MFINLLLDNSVSVCCWWPLILFVDAGQLAPTDGLRDKCHAGNVKQHQFYTVALLGSPQGAGTPVCACFVHTLCKKINKQKTLCCLFVCVCVFKAAESNHPLPAKSQRDFFKENNSKFLANQM